MVLALVVALVTTGCSVPWTQRLGDNTHSSRTPDAGLTAANVATLKEKWRYQPGACNGVTTGAQWFATPVTFKGVIYIGDDYGCLHAIDEASGHVLWTRPNVFVRSTTCGQPLGIVSSIAVTDDGTGKPVLYFHAPDGYLYKLRGSDGSTIWRSVVMIPSSIINDVYAWSSPTVAGNKVIVGISSNCDTPFVPGQVRAYDTATGRLLWTHKTIPDGYTGAGDWYDAAVDAAGDVYVTTGSTYDDIAAAHPNTTPGFEQYSILKLSGSTGGLLWKAPAPEYLGDPDYGTSPILFDGGGVALVGAWNKDGWFRAFRRDTGAFVWQARTGTPGSRTDNAIAGGAVFDGHRLFIASNGTQRGRRMDPDEHPALGADGRIDGTGVGPRARPRDGRARLAAVAIRSRSDSPSTSWGRARSTAAASSSARAATSSNPTCTPHTTTGCTSSTRTPPSPGSSVTSRTATARAPRRTGASSHNRSRNSARSSRRTTHT